MRSASPALACEAVAMIFYACKYRNYLLNCKIIIYFFLLLSIFNTHQLAGDD